MTDIRSALARADGRYSKRVGYDEPLTAEHLDALAAAIQPTAGDTVPDDTALNDAERTIARQHGELTALGLERDQLVDELKETRLDAHRRVDAAVRATENTASALREQIENLRIDLAAAQANTAPEHQHAYEWPTPDQPPQSCDCGHPYPRTVLAEELADGEDVEPDQEAFDGLMGRIRDELSTWEPHAEQRHLTVATERCATREAIHGG